MFKASGVLFLGLCRGRSNGDLRCYGEGEHFALLQVHTVLCRCNRRGKRKEKKGEVPDSCAKQVTCGSLAVAAGRLVVLVVGSIAQLGYGALDVDYIDGNGVDGLPNNGVSPRPA